MASTQTSGWPALTAVAHGHGDRRRRCRPRASAALRGSRAWSVCGKGDFSSNTNTVAPSASVHPAIVQQAQGLPLHAALAVVQAVVLARRCARSRRLRRWPVPRSPARRGGGCARPGSRRVALQTQRGAPGGHAVRAQAAPDVCATSAAAASAQVAPSACGACSRARPVSHPLVDGGGVHARCAKVGVVQQVAQKARVVAHAQQRAVFQRGASGGGWRHRGHGRAQSAWPPWGRTRGLISPPSCDAVRRCALRHRRIARWRGLPARAAGARTAPGRSAVQSRCTGLRRTAALRSRGRVS